MISIVLKGSRRAPAVTDRAEAQQRGATPCVRSGAVAKRSYPTSKEQWLHGLRRTERSCSMFKGRRGDFTQGKEHRLHFAGAAVK